LAEVQSLMVTSLTSSTMQTFTPFSLRKSVWAFVLLFLVLFFSRLTYGYYYPGTTQNQSLISFSDIASPRNNYASEKFKAEAPPPTQQAGPTSGQTQKYEKIATLRAKSSQFEADEIEAKTKIKNFGAVIQFEQNIGNEGRRTMQLLIGIAPSKFDSFYVEMQNIGTILGKEVTKTDKTNEFLQLNAKRISLEKIRNSLLELKGRGGRIDEYIGLENRVLEIEEQLQGLGVQLGDYDEENEFCTVKFFMAEGDEPRGISLAQRLKVAFEWTASYYALLMLGLLLTLVAALVLSRVIEAIRGR
jgi:hypothetical protein